MENFIFPELMDPETAGHQRFLGLQSVERSDDMVFALERRKSGKKIKQHPVIRHRDNH